MKMDFIKPYGAQPDMDLRLSENNSLKNHENQNRFQTSKVHDLNSFFEQSHISLVCHKEFLVEHDAGNIFCKVCSVNMDSFLELPEHLKTKSHEDSIITLVKSNLPPSLHKNMEFITFYDSNLYCNLCKCNISWSSENTFKTIVDIIAHNESNDHLSKKSNNTKVPASLHKNDESLKVLKALSAVDSLLSESITLIDYKVQPMFKCKLCKKVIEFEENQSQMLINFSLHLNSEGHKKCLKTYLVLKSFEESHLLKNDSRHSFSMVKDRIFCSCSSRNINPTIDSLRAHVSEKLDDDLDDINLSSELNSVILEEPNYRTTSVLSSATLTDLSEMYSDQTESALFIKAPSEVNGENTSSHITIPLNNKYESCNNTVQEARGMMTLNNFVLNESSSGVYSALKTLENKDFFVSRVSKYLAKVNNQVVCDVCDAVICYSSDEKVLKDSIKQHFIGEKHKNFMEKLTFDERETIAQLTFEHPTVQANKHCIKASGKYLHCMLCQYTLVLSLDLESLQKKLAAHCSGKYHLKESGKSYNSVFETRPSSSQSTSTPTPTADNTAKQLKTSPIKEHGAEESVNNKNGHKERFGRPNSVIGDGKQYSGEAGASFRESLRNDPNAIKITNINPDSCSKTLMSLMKSFGPLRHFHFSKDPKTGLCNGFALVHYQTRQSADRALCALNGLPTKHGTLAVKWAYNVSSA